MSIEHYTNNKAVPSSFSQNELNAHSDTEMKKEENEFKCATIRVKGFLICHLCRHSPLCIDFFVYTQWTENRGSECSTATILPQKAERVIGRVLLSECDLISSKPNKHSSPLQLPPANPTDPLLHALPPSLSLFSLPLILRLRFSPSCLLSFIAN